MITGLAAAQRALREVVGAAFGTGPEGLGGWFCAEIESISFYSSARSMILPLHATANAEIDWNLRHAADLGTRQA
jgi:hypothetical protein